MKVNQGKSFYSFKSEKKNILTILSRSVCRRVNVLAVKHADFIVE